jgi:GDPmannose 4,6-dehydratase
VTVKRALITGITGQDGSYLAEYLLSLNYEVCGLVRPTSSMNRWRIDHLGLSSEKYKERFRLVYGDLSDEQSIERIIRDFIPDEVYNLAAQSHVRTSFDVPETTFATVGFGVSRLLKACFLHAPNARIYQAGSSEMFGNSAAPQNLNSPFDPCSPYAAAKCLGFLSVKHYRESLGLYATNGIAFNHESPRRGENFVTRKIARGIAQIFLKMNDKLTLGNLDAQRDWGYSPEYVIAMHKMLQLDEPIDLVFGTDKSFSVREFLSFCSSYVGINWEEFVEFDKSLLRPTEVNQLQADSGQAREIIGWSPSVFGSKLAEILVDSEIRRLQDGTIITDEWIMIDQFGQY